MSISVEKGFNVSLSGLNAGLSRLAVGLGWDASDSSAPEFDLDASAFVIKPDGNVLSDKYFVFFNNLKSPEGAVTHQGDNLTGEGEGDDEVIFVDLNKLPTEATRIVFVVTIYKGREQQQFFSQVSNAFIRVVDRDNNDELARYDLGQDFGQETSLIFGDVYLENGEWNFRAVGQGYEGGLHEAAQNFGVYLR